MGNIPGRLAAGTYFLTLDGAPSGYLRSAEGGNPVGEVVAVPAGPGEFVRKQLGGVRYEDVQLRAGFSMSKDLYQWINASWQLKPTRHSGSVVEVGADGKPREQRTFSDALVSETTFPALDGASKDPAFLTVRLMPEEVRFEKPDSATAPARPQAQKQFTAANFRFELGDLPCSRVSKIDAFTVKQTIAMTTGPRRIVRTDPSGIEFPNLRVTFSAADLPKWSAWFDEFVVNGSNDDQHELSGAIVLLAPDRKQELARVELQQVGIFALRRESAEAGRAQVARAVADLYCERMSLKIA